MDSSFRRALNGLIGMVRSPRLTLRHAARDPRPLGLALLVIAIAAACSAGFLMTRVGQLAALDQQTRQLESFGVVIDDQRYDELRRLVPYRPAISAALIVVGWPIMWLLIAWVLHLLGSRSDRNVRYSQVLTIVVYASAIFAVREMVAAPLNYARESLGGATSLSLLMPAFAESTFLARLVGAVDLFAVWWVVLMAMGLGILYRTRTLPIARWLFGTYACGAAALALTQALRGGI